MIRIFLIGYMACGKSTLGRKLANQTGLSFVDLDGFIEQKYQKTVSSIFETLGQDAFREIERKALEEVSTFENVIIATGGGAPCFFDNMRLMNQTGETIYICLTPSQLAQRLENSRAGKRPLVQNKQGAELLQFIQIGLTQREAFYSQAKLIVSGSDDAIIQKIRQHCHLN